MGGQLDSLELPPAPSYCCTNSCNLNDTRLSLTTAVPRSQSLSGWATVGIPPGRVSREATYGLGVRDRDADGVVCDDALAMKWLRRPATDTR